MARESGIEAAAVTAAVEQQNGSAKTAIGFASFKPQIRVPAQKAEEAVQFYKAALGAEEFKRVNHPKRKADQEHPFLLSAELKIGSFSFLVCEQSEDAAAATETGGGAVMFRLETEDVAGAVSNALKAGAVPDGEIVEDEGPCGGGLVGKVKDPFGLVWAIASVGDKCCGAAAAADA